MTEETTKPESWEDKIDKEILKRFYADEITGEQLEFLRTVSFAMKKYIHYLLEAQRHQLKKQVLEAVGVAIDYSEEFNETSLAIEMERENIIRRIEAVFEKV